MLQSLTDCLNLTDSDFFGSSVAVSAHTEERRPASVQELYCTVRYCTRTHVVRAAAKVFL